MANRAFRRVQAMQNELKILEGQFVVGSTGAVESVIGLGISDVTRNDVGNYTITLEDTYNRLLGFNAIVNFPTFSGVSSIQLASATGSIQFDFAAKEVTFACFDDAHSAADPAEGSTVIFSIFARNSTVHQEGE